MTWARRTAVLAVASLATFACAEARADDSRDFGLFGLQAYATTWARPPSLVIQGDSAPPRIAGLTSPSGAFTSAGVGADMTLRIDGFVAQFLQLRYSEAFGQPRYGIQTADESPFRVTAGPMHLFELGSPILGVSGLGGQVVGNRYKVRIVGDWGVAWAWSSATVRDPWGALWQSSMTTQSFYLRAEIDACVRLGASVPADSTAWGCLSAASNVYEFDWFSGTSFGVRVDL